MDGVYERVMLSEVENDDARFREIINDAIAAGRVEGFTKFTKESAASKKRRLKAAQAEAGEAMELAEELGVKDKLFGKGKNGKGRKDEDDEDALKALIMGRQQARASFIDQLEAKYAVPSKKGKKGRSAKEAPQAEGEPSEEQFQAAAAKLSSQTARGKGRAAKKSPEPEDEEDQPSGRRSKRSRHV
jgi:DnaJ family protein C protein 9